MTLDFPDSSVGKESTCNAGGLVRFLGQEDLLEKGKATHSSFLGLRLWISRLRIRLQCRIPGLGGSPGEGKGCPLQYSGLENSMDSTVHGVTKSRT